MIRKRHSAVLLAGIVAAAGIAVQGTPAAKPTKTTICHRTMSARSPTRRSRSRSRCSRDTSRILATSFRRPPRDARVRSHALPGRRTAVRESDRRRRGPGPGDRMEPARPRSDCASPGPGPSLHHREQHHVACCSRSIHLGAAGVPGPVVVTLITPDADGSVEGCVSAPRALIKQILKNPAGYYVTFIRPTSRRSDPRPAGLSRGASSNCGAVR